jgi:predicted ATPase
MAILEHLVARRFLVRADGIWHVRGKLSEAELDVPERLAQMIEVEMEGLSAEEQRMLGAGSAMGIAFPSWAVAAAVEEDLARVEETCDALARRVHFLERAGQDELPDGTGSEFYVFVHGLYREVLYQRQAAGRRAQWHRRIADRLGELFQGRETAVARERSMHYEAAGDWRRASAALSDAARHARERGATAEAHHLMEQALRAAEHLCPTERTAAVEAIHTGVTKAQEEEAAWRDRERNLTKSGRKPDDRNWGDGAA